MKLTTRGRYAVTAMLDLALHSDAGAVALADIADRQGISLSYLEQLFARLRRSGLIDSVRGPGGGYLLAMNPNRISVADIIVAIDENMDATRCGGEENCHIEGRCLTHHLWQELSDKIYHFLNEMTLEDLAKRPAVQEVALRQDRRAIVAVP